MSKIIKLEPTVKVKNVPAWKNRALIDEVKADFVKVHNEKLRAKEKESTNR